MNILWIFNLLHSATYIWIFVIMFVFHFNLMHYSIPIQMYLIDVLFKYKNSINSTYMKSKKKINKLAPPWHLLLQLPFVEPMLQFQIMKLLDIFNQAPHRPPIAVILKPARSIPFVIVTLNTCNLCAFSFILLNTPK